MGSRVWQVPRCRETGDKHVWVPVRQFPPWDRCTACGAEFKQELIGNARVAPPPPKRRSRDGKG